MLTKSMMPVFLYQAELTLIRTTNIISYLLGRGIGLEFGKTVQKVKEVFSQVPGHFQIF